MSPRFSLTCIIALIIATTVPSATAAINENLKVEPPALYLTQDLPEILLYIFSDTYIILSNTIVIVPGCTLPPTINLQSDILESLLVKASASFVLEIQSDFSLYDTAAPTFLWFIDSKESIRIIFKSLREHRDKLSNQALFTVVFVGALSIEDQFAVAKELFEAFWSDSATDVLFLTSDEQRTTIYTYYAYSSETCGSPQIVAHNYYWHSQENVTTPDSPNSIGFQFEKPFFPEKCDNLYKCAMKIATFDQPPFMILTQFENGSTYFDGIEGIVVRVLSQRLHFTPILVHPEDEERWGACNEERTNCTGALQLLLSNKANMSIGLFGTNTFRGYDTLTNSISYFMVKVVFAVPRGRPVANIHKLLLPFKLIMWIYIVFCFSTGLLLILGLKLFRLDVRAFVVGRYNAHPILTMVNVWLGNSVNRLPGRNFSRFLLMMWILLAFVLRSAYQGALFDILRLKKTTSPVNSLAKMAEAKYEIYVSNRLVKYIRQMDAKIQPLVHLVPTTAIDELLMQTLDPSFNGVIVVVEPTILHFNQHKVPDGFQIIHSPLVITTIQNTIYVDQSSCVLDAINRELWSYLSSGLMHAWATKFMKDVGRETERGDDFKAMKLADFMGIFQVYGVLMGVIVVVFIGELVWGRGR